MHLAVSLLGYAPPARPWQGDYCAILLPELLAHPEVRRATLLVTPYGYRHWQHLASDRVALQQVQGLDERKRRRFYAERYILPGMLRELRPDAVFAPLGGALLQPAARYIYRLASLAYLLEPERFSLLEQLFYGKTIPASCRVADRVVVDYDALAQTVVDRGMSAMDRIRVVPQGFDASAAQPREQTILLLGGDDDVQLTKVWSNVIIHGRLPRGWEDATYVCLSRQAGEVSGPRLLAIEDAPVDTYKKYLASASVALCLSASDTGLASLRQALAAGLPVIAAETAATRAVAGDAALYVPPCEATDTASALAILLADDALRAELGSKALEHSHARTWQQTAAQLIALLKE